MGGIQYYIMPNNNRKPSKNGNGKNKRRNAGNGDKSKLQNLRGITQSVALSVNNAFGDSARPQTIVKGLDAFDSCHVPLPRAVGDYTVIRTTEVVSGTETFNLFGPVMNTNTSTVGGSRWSNICCIRGVAGGTAINAANNANRQVFSAMSSSAWDDCRITPAAFTVKIMNPEALQTTSGIVYIGRARQMLNVGGSTRTWDTFANELVSYSSPELCAAGRLALRGAKVDAVPYDMNSLADFRLSSISSDSNFTWSDDSINFDGFAPIFIYNPDGIDLQFLVCCEWRVRFDPANPAYASHTYHRPSTTGYWDRLQQLTSRLGNGVMDLVEKSAPQLLMNMAQETVNRQLRLTND
jgi:hypothetical protein